MGEYEEEETTPASTQTVNIPAGSSPSVMQIQIPPVLLEGFKRWFHSDTISGAILAIVGTIGSTAAVVASGAGPEIVGPVIGTGVLSIYGSIKSIFGRTKATKKIG